tara:strand:- start:3955 stop:4494 length:540 start_codon:yes stop_codon:yes gene_type:complete
MKTKIAPNLTTSLALPLLGWNKSVFQPFLVNAYTRHEGINTFDEDHLYVLLKWSDDERFKKLDEVLIKHETHVSLYEPDTDCNYVMHVFKISDDMLSDYKKFLSGKYSKMSYKAKKLITRSSKPGGTTEKVINRSPELRERLEEKLDVTLADTDEVWTSINDVHTYQKEVFHEAVLMDL